MAMFSMVTVKTMDMECQSPRRRQKRPRIRSLVLPIVATRILWMMAFQLVVWDTVAVHSQQTVAVQGNDEGELMLNGNALFDGTGLLDEDTQPTNVDLFEETDSSDFSVAEETIDVERVDVWSTSSTDDSNVDEENSDDNDPPLSPLLSDYDATEPDLVQTTTPHVPQPPTAEPVEEPVIDGSANTNRNTSDFPDQQDLALKPAVVYIKAPDKTLDSDHQNTIPQPPTKEQFDEPVVDASDIDRLAQNEPIDVIATIIPEPPTPMQSDNDSMPLIPPEHVLLENDDDDDDDATGSVHATKQSGNTMTATSQEQSIAAHDINIASTEELVSLDAEKDASLDANVSNPVGLLPNVDDSVDDKASEGPQKGSLAEFFGKVKAKETAQKQHIHQQLQSDETIMVNTHPKMTSRENPTTVKPDEQLSRSENNPVAKPADDTDNGTRQQGTLPTDPSSDEKEEVPFAKDHLYPTHCSVWGHFDVARGRPASLDILYQLFQENVAGNGTLDELSKRSEYIPKNQSIPIVESTDSRLSNRTKGASSPVEASAVDDATERKATNNEFVAGLDDIDKLFEGIEPPDELDVGVDGTSIQEVLMGSATRVLLKRVSVGAGYVKDVLVYGQKRLVNHTREICKDLKPLQVLRKENGDFAPFHRFRDSDGILAPFRSLRNTHGELALPSRSQIAVAAKRVLRGLSGFYAKVENVVDKLFEGGDTEEFRFVPANDIVKPPVSS